MGYDMCLMIGCDAVKMAEVIDPPSDRVIGFMLTVGKAVKPAMPKGGQLALSEVAGSRTVLGLVGGLPETPITLMRRGRSPLAIAQASSTRRTGSDIP
jgi:hypothetical protein